MNRYHRNSNCEECLDLDDEELEAANQPSVERVVSRDAVSGTTSFEHELRRDSALPHGSLNRPAGQRYCAECNAFRLDENDACISCGARWNPL